MRFRLALLPALCALVAPFGSPAHAAPGCGVLDWRGGDWCTFEAPAGAFTYGGVATKVCCGEEVPWVAVQIVFNGQVIASCFDQGTDIEPAYCEQMTPGVPALTHVCQVFGTGGPEFHCADPPPLPLPAG